MRVTSLACALLLASLSVLAAPNGRAAAPLAADQQFFRLPGDGPWDYVTYDPVHGRVFIGRFNGVQVVRADTGRLEATIGARSGDHGAVIAPDLGRVFTSDAVARRLGVYDATSLAVQRNVPLDGDPDGLAYIPENHRVLVFLPHTHQVVAIDARSLQPVGHLDIGGEPEEAAGDGHGAVFVSLRDSGDIVRLATGTLHETARWSSGCERPSPLALDVTRKRLFIGCRDQRMMVLDSETGRKVTSVPTGAGTDALAFDAKRQLVIVSNGGGSLTLVRVNASDRYERLGDIPTARGARTMALDPAGGRLFTVTADIAREQPPTKARPFPLLIPVAGTFRMIVVRLPS